MQRHVSRIATARGAQIWPSEASFPPNPAQLFYVFRIAVTDDTDDGRDTPVGCLCERQSEHDNQDGVGRRAQGAGRGVWGPGKGYLDRKNATSGFRLSVIETESRFITRGAGSGGFYRSGDPRSRPGGIYWPRLGVARPSCHCTLLHLRTTPAPERIPFCSKVPEIYFPKIRITRNFSHCSLHQP